MNDGDTVNDNIQMDDEPVDLLAPRPPYKPEELEATPLLHPANQPGQVALEARYFQAQNCRRWPELFEPFDTLGGILWGICATDNPETLSMIAALIAQPKLGVSEITQDEYHRVKQKKTPTSHDSTSFSPRPAPSSISPVSLAGSDRADLPTIHARVRALNPGQPGPVGPEALKGSGNAVVGEVKAPEPVLEAGKPVPSVAEALQVGEVEPAPTAKVRNSRKK